MDNNISIQKINDKLKVISPYNEEFINEARYLRGKWKEGAWWFDDSASDHVREILLKLWNTTGEAPYENCHLLIKNFSKSSHRGPIYLFQRMIARAFSRLSGIKWGADIHFMTGICRPGGTLMDWETVILNGTFEIRNFPMPATTLPDVVKAINEGWCEIVPIIKEVPIQTANLKKVDWGPSTGRLELRFNRV